MSRAAAPSPVALRSSPTHAGAADALRDLVTLLLQPSGGDAGGALLLHGQLGVGVEVLVGLLQLGQQDVRGLGRAARRGAALRAWGVSSQRVSSTAGPGGATASHRRSARSGRISARISWLRRNAASVGRASGARRAPGAATRGHDGPSLRRSPSRSRRAGNAFLPDETAGSAPRRHRCSSRAAVLGAKRQRLSRSRPRARGDGTRQPR